MKRGFFVIWPKQNDRGALIIVIGRTEIWITREKKKPRLLGVYPCDRHVSLFRAMEHERRLAIAEDCDYCEVDDD
jgi:hypothetical protein